MAAEPLQAQGVARGADEALLSSEMAGRIVRIANDGDAFHKGDPLVEFSCDGQQAEEDMARAAEKGARARVENQRRLDAVQSAGQLDVALAEALVAEAVAKVRASIAKTRLCRVTAPYDGTILKREAKPYESVNVLAPLLRIARRGPMEVTAIVPAAWLAWLREGLPVTFVAGPTGQRVAGRITRLGGAVDSSSQTIEVRGELAPGPTNPKAGLAGLVTFEPDGSAGP